MTMRISPEVEIAFSLATREASRRRHEFVTIEHLLYALLFDEETAEVLRHAGGDTPLLKKKPSDYMRDMYYSSQPMEIQDRKAMECTFRMMNAETQLLYSSDYPHWDFDLPSTIYDLPFLTEKAKHNILGGTAARLFKLPPRNEKQRENLARFGNLSAAA